MKITTRAAKVALSILRALNPAVAADGRSDEAAAKPWIGLSPGDWNEATVACPCGREEVVDLRALVLSDGHLCACGRRLYLKVRAE